MDGKHLAMKSMDEEDKNLRITDETAKYLEYEEMFYDVDEKGKKKLNPMKLSGYVLSHYRFLTMRDNDDIYYYEDGLWKKNEKKLKEIARELLGKGLTTHTSAELSLHFKIASYFEREKIDKDLNLICMENGVFDIDKMELLPHDPKYYMTTKIPIIYNKDADCLKIKQFFSEILDPDDISIVQELFGYLLYKRYRFHKGFMFIGSGSNGKTTTINLAEAFIGTENCCGESLQNLENNRFASAGLFGKLANMNPDLPSAALKQTSVFKSATGEDMMTGENKFGQRFTFTNYAKMIFACNKLPEIADDIDAIWRRWIPINFTRTFPDDKANTNLINELSTPEELSGLFNWAIEGLKRVLANNKFSFSRGWEEVRDWYVKLSSPSKSYIEKNIVTDPTGAIVKEELYGKFLQYCKDNKLTAQSEKLFSQRLKECHPGIESSRMSIDDGFRKNCWKGITYYVEEVDVNGVKDVIDSTLFVSTFTPPCTTPKSNENEVNSGEIEDSRERADRERTIDTPDIVDTESSLVVDEIDVSQHKGDIPTQKGKKVPKIDDDDRIEEF